MIERIKSIFSSAPSSGLALYSFSLVIYVKALITMNYSMSTVKIGKAVTSVCVTYVYTHPKVPAFYKKNLHCHHKLCFILTKMLYIKMESFLYFHFSRAQQKKQGPNRNTPHRLSCTQRFTPTANLA